MTSHSAGEALALASLDDVLTARQRAEQRLEEGTVATLLINPALAVTGGILGGALVSALVWRAAWSTRTRRQVLELDRRYLRRRR